MKAPLYKDADPPVRLDERLRREAHRGLYFDRFFAGYSEGFGPIDGDGEKAKWCHRFAGPAGSEEMIEQFAVRQRQLVSALNGRSQVFRNDWRMAIGTGNAHPLENGFSFHPVLGVPYVCGAAVKGLLRAWMEQWSDAPDKEDTIRRWFGNPPPGANTGNEQYAGELIFFDAVPTDRISMVVDVMTPHMGKWYEKGAENPTLKDNMPGDWHNPVPISWMVCSGASLLFSVAARSERCQQELEQVMEELVQALDWLGCGAKTAIGYGHFVPDDSGGQNLDRLEKKAEEEQLSEEENKVRAFERAVTDMPADPPRALLSELQNQAAEFIKAAEDEGELFSALDSAQRKRVADHLTAFYKKTSWGNNTKRSQRKAAVEKYQG